MFRGKIATFKLYISMLIQVQDSRCQKVHLKLMLTQTPSQAVGGANILPFGIILLIYQIHVLVYFPAVIVQTHVFQRNLDFIKKTQVENKKIKLKQIIL